MKTWENTEETYPNSITYKLLRDGKEVAAHTANKENWNHVFVNDSTGNKLPKVNPSTGNDYVYTVEEDKVEGYTTTKNPENPYNIINKQTTREIVLEKQWINGPKPDATLTLRRKVKSDEGKNLSEEEDKNFRRDFVATVSNPRREAYKVPTHRADGREYEYYVVEENVADGYTAKVNGFTVVNTYSSPKTSIEAKKVWKDDKSKNRPKIWFKLMRKNTKTNEIVEVKDSIKEVLSEKNDGQEEIVIKWIDVEKTDKDGNTFDYLVREVDAKGNDYTPLNYKKEENGLVVTNTKDVYNFPGVPGDITPAPNPNPDKPNVDKPSSEKPNTDKETEKPRLSKENISNETLVKNTILPRTGSKNESIFSLAISLLAISIGALFTSRRYE